MDFTKNKNYFFILSIVIIVAGLLGALINGVQLDIQFQGGTRLSIETVNDEARLSDIASAIEAKTGVKADLQFSRSYNPEDTDNDIVMLVLNISKDYDINDAKRTELINMLETEYPQLIKPNGEFLVYSVEPFLGRELLQNGIIAAFIASLLIVIYVALRFSVMSGVSAALMAIVALIHDAAVMFSVYSLLRIPLNEVFIAAVLTILGYSMNDTIVVYDRIRENTGLMKKSSLPQVVNASINQTLSRSINTTATSLIAIVLVYIFSKINGIQSLANFSLPLIIGMLSGAYSSIFIASPLWMMWRESRLRKRVRA